jgi:hypothetical protein
MGQVSRNRLDTLAKLTSELLEHLVTAPGGNNMGAARMQRTDDGLTDAAGSAGNESSAAVDLHGRIVFR